MDVKDRRPIRGVRRGYVGRERPRSGPPSAVHGCLGKARLPDGRHPRCPSAPGQERHDEVPGLRGHFFMAHVPGPAWCTLWCDPATAAASPTPTTVVDHRHEGQWQRTSTKWPRLSVRRTSTIPRETGAKSVGSVMSVPSRGVLATPPGRVERPRGLYCVLGVLHLRSHGCPGGVRRTGRLALMAARGHVGVLLDSCQDVGRAEGEP